MITKEKIKMVLVLFVVGVFAWFGVDAFVDLVVKIYHFLDGFIWAFFAGIIAFFIAVWLVMVMIYITAVAIAFLIATVAVIWQKLEK